MLTDPFNDHVGVEVLAVGAGTARATLATGLQHTNFQGNVNGAAVFALADAALARACNSGGEPAVASVVSLHLLRAVRPGDRLVAEAREEHRGRRLGLYRIRILREPDAELVAVADGQVAVVRTRS